eukprot:gene10728-11876_t
MASNENMNIEDADSLDSPEDQISDVDDDDLALKKPESRKDYFEQDTIIASQDLSQKSDFQDISDEDEEDETFSPTTNDNNQDEMDEEHVESSSNANINEEDSIVKGNNAFSHENTSDIIDNVDNKDSREKENEEETVEDEEEGEIEKQQERLTVEAGMNDGTREDEDEYIDAPVPSPFSDIGDLSGSDHAIISDILKETSHGNHISPELEGFASKLEKFEEPEKLPVMENEEKPKNDQEGIDNALKSNEEDSQLTEQEKSSIDDGSKQNDPNKKSGGDVGGLIADIFGESDEEEEFEGFGEDELGSQKQKPKSRAVIYDDDDEEENYLEEKPEQSAMAEEKEIDDQIGRVPLPDEEDDEDSEDEDRKSKEIMVSDFDLMMQRKKEAMQQRRRSKKDFDIINDNDDIIAAMIRKMREAAEEDRMLNQAGRAATKKMKLLDSVVSHLNKSDLQHTFIDCGILPVMKDWLSPLPDHSLPHLMIRKQFLKILSEFPALDRGALKMSGIGRAVMLLFKHPKETRQNRNIAGKIVAQWARPIFGVQTNFKDMSKEEREERDRLNVPTYKKRRRSSLDDGQGSSSSINNPLQDEKRPRRPGDKGFIARARVPRPSNKDYVVRPEPNIGYADMGGMGNRTQKKTLSRFEKQMRKYKERKQAQAPYLKRTEAMALKADSIEVISGD